MTDDKKLFISYILLLADIMVVQQWFGLVGVGAGALFAYSAFKTYRIAKRRHRFEPVTATVVDSQLEESKSTTQSGSPDTGRPGTVRTSSTRYIPHITWEYTVGGKTYTNNKRYSGSGDKETQQEVVDTYPEGETVEVQYDPADPSVSFLESVPETEGAMVKGVIGGVLLILGVVLLVYTPF
jgi:hypothetical protein